ncbi:MAG: NAD-dependent epimerase/dehydratase family protein [Ignavibacteriaceae bacterium]|nr:NAD-dependent epimerase/dehydratase family protein [Ignavibacteriaceae bacterium]
MKIFITGGTGFIGRYTTELLSKTNHQLKLLVRKTSNSSVLKKLNITIVEGNLADKKSLLEGMKDCDSVINIAGHYTFWEPDNNIYSTVNIEGTRNVMECALETGIKKIVHISTAGIYGKPKDDPFTEESSVGPIQYSEYFRTKYEAEKIVWNLFKEKGLPVVVIYPVCVLGAGDTKASGRYLRDLINRKLPATIFNKHIFTFVYVKDVAQAIINALEKENNIGKKYLIGNYRCTWKDMNKLISEISGVPLPIFKLPDALTMMNAFFLTGLANLIKKPPLWGMALDQMKVMKAGFNVDGSKAEKELGIKYTPIRVALEEAIASFK